MGISGGSYVVSKGISEETTRRKIDAAAKHGAGGL